MSGIKTDTRRGFTIVELLIVIVVIAILATITIIGFNGVQGRANDAAIQNDFSNIAKQFELYKIDNGAYPVGDTQLATIGLKVAKSAYGNGMIGGIYNLLYCRVAADGPDKFALIAGSKSGNIFVYTSESGSAEKRSSWYVDSSSAANCRGAGINQTDGSDRDFFYIGPNWQSYID